MSFEIVGPQKATCTRDEEGHRTYKLVSLIKGNDVDGPAQALLCPGLPVLGSTWSYLGEFDVWAWCRADTEVMPVVEGERLQSGFNYYKVTNTFSTKPVPKDKQRCQDNPIENPLLEQPKISGEFSVKSEEATEDRFGYKITNSAHEQMRGPQVEFDMSHPKVVIEMNVGILDIGLLAFMANKVNAYPIWGLMPRMWKCNIPSWERKFYGTCSLYYTIKMEFEGNYATWDRDLLDEGTKVLNGHWDRITGAWVLDDIAGNPPDRFNPQHFIKFTDRKNQACKVMLDGQGQPSGVRISTGNFGSRIDAVRLATSTFVDQANDAARLMVGACDIADVGTPAATANAQTAQRLRDDFQNLATLADGLNQSVTRNNSAVTIIAAAQNIVTVADGLDARLTTLIAAVVAAAGGSPDQFSLVLSNVYGISAMAAAMLVELQIPYTDTGTGADTTEADPGHIHVEKYDEADFLLLGVPLTF